MTHGEKAQALFMEGYNCAQAVTLAFADDMGLDRETAARISSSFGGGLGRLREVCGCVSGMAFVAGELYGYADPKAVEEKAAHYALIQELAKEFKERNGSIICRELLSGITGDMAPTPEKRTESYYKKRPCARLAADAAEILERKMESLKRNAAQELPETAPAAVQNAAQEPLEAATAAAQKTANPTAETQKTQ